MHASRPLLLAAAISLLAPVAAGAESEPTPIPPCEKTPTEGDVAGAKGAFQAGQGSFEEGDYNRAISYWEDAYRRDCTAHALLLNLARAYELNNQKRHAVVSLEAYLARQPSSPQRDQIARRIEGLNDKLAKEAATPGPAAGGGPTEPKTDGPVGSAPETDGGGKKSLTPLIVAGAGGVITIVGGLLYLKAAGDVSDVEDKCGPGRKCPQSLAEEGNDARKRQNLWGVVTVGGIAVTAGGLVWYFLSKPSGSAPTTALAATKRPLPQVSPVVGRGFTGLALSGSF
ncbi:MAG: hypothetical protein IPI67_30835 [Myxococcales bacterium]|nr:hypothetical protein [Myxococcales bacterium]